jgi:hypothetical protein
MSGDIVVVGAQLGAVFGAIVAFCVWQLMSVRKDQRAAELKRAEIKPN